MPVANTARIILNGGLRSRLDYIHRAAPVRKIAQIGGQDAARCKRLAGAHLAQIFEISLDASHPALGQGGP